MQDNCGRSRPSRRFVASLWMQCERPQSSGCRSIPKKLRLQAASLLLPFRDNKSGTSLAIGTLDAVDGSIWHKTQHENQGEHPN